VRVVYDKDGARIETPYDISLFDVQPESGVASSIVSPLGPADYPLDPLTLV
jgi:hypothetical protein